MFGWVRKVVLRNTPLSSVEDTEERKWFRYDVKISIKAVVSLIFQLVELVEQSIGKELAGTKGALMFDGWTCNRVNYVALYASYCKTVAVYRFRNLTPQLVLQLNLLALAPLAHVGDNEDADEDATLFDADSHVSFFQKTMKYYDQNLEDWCICFITDNATVNKKIARITKKPLVGCLSHKL